MTTLTTPATRADGDGAFRVPTYDHYDPANVGTAVVDVTPDLARTWLRFNERNRPESDEHVGSLASQARQGDFDLNGETVKIAYTGKLLEPRVAGSLPSFHAPEERGERPVEPAQRLLLRTRRPPALRRSSARRPSAMTRHAAAFTDRKAHMALPDDPPF